MGDNLEIIVGFQGHEFSICRLDFTQQIIPQDLHPMIFEEIQHELSSLKGIGTVDYHELALSLESEPSESLRQFIIFKFVDKSYVPHVAKDLKLLGALVRSSERFVACP